jgi:hypothetical protein
LKPVEAPLFKVFKLHFEDGKRSRGRPKNRLLIKTVLHLGGGNQLSMTAKGDHGSQLIFTTSEVSS